MKPPGKNDPIKTITFLTSGLVRALALGAGLFTVTLCSHAQSARFFRISGPAATTITAFLPDGTMVWSNAQPGEIFTVQMATSLAGTINWTDYVQIPAANGFNSNRLVDISPPSGMVFIPSGIFTMGNCMDPSEGYADEMPLRTVYVSSFYMDKYDVTKALWDGVSQWATNHGYNFDYMAQGKAGNHPAHSMTWHDAVKWCNARSQKEGRTPAYYFDPGLSSPYTYGRSSPYVKWDNGYRLPTEAEWEKGARGGASGQRFPWGNTIFWTEANYYAYVSIYSYDVNPTGGSNPIFNDGVFPYTSPVDFFAPNGYGLYDMGGNVYQWCWDWYGGYSSGSQSDPHGPTGGTARVERGGRWGGYAGYCRSAFRNNFGPTEKSYSVGFRSVLPLNQ